MKLDPDGKANAYAWGEAVKALAANDPAAAVEVWSRRGDLEETDFHESLAFVIGKSWGERDPVAARRWADSLPAGDARRLALHACLSALAHKDPRAALEQLASAEELGEAHDSNSGERGFPADDFYTGDARTEIAAYFARRDFTAAMATAPELTRYFPR